MYTDSDTAINKPDESVSLTRMGEEKVYFCQNLPLQSLWSKALCRAVLERWEHCLLCCVVEVMPVWSSLTCMPMKSMAVQILAGSMACLCHTVNTDLKLANVCGFLQCVTVSTFFVLNNA